MRTCPQSGFHLNQISLALTSYIREFFWNKKCWGFIRFQLCTYHNFPKYYPNNLDILTLERKYWLRAAIKTDLRETNLADLIVSSCRWTKRYLSNHVTTVKMVNFYWHSSVVPIPPHLTLRYEVQDCIHYTFNPYKASVFLWNIGKRCRPWSDAALRDVWSWSPQFAYKMFYWNLNKNEKYHLTPLKFETDSSYWYR